MIPENSVQDTKFCNRLQGTLTRTNILICMLFNGRGRQNNSKCFPAPALPSKDC